MKVMAMNAYPYDISIDKEFGRALVSQHFPNYKNVRKEC